MALDIEAAAARGRAILETYSGDRSPLVAALIDLDAVAHEDRRDIVGDLALARRAVRDELLARANPVQPLDDRYLFACPICGWARVYGTKRQAQGACSSHRCPKGTP